MKRVAEIIRANNCSGVHMNLKTAYNVENAAAVRKGPDRVFGTNWKWFSHQKADLKRVFFNFLKTNVHTV